MKSSKFISVLSIVIFILGLAIFIYSYGVNKNITEETVAVTPELKVTYLFKVILKDGTQLPTTRKILRLVRADGSWKEFATEFNGQGQITKTYTQFGLNGKGVFRVNEDRKVIFYVGPRPSQISIYNPQSERNQSGYIGDGNILGFQTIITKPKRDDGLTLETHSAVGLNGLMLKMVDITQDHTTIIEAIDLRIEKISPEEFGDLPNYTIDSSFAQ